MKKILQRTAFLLAVLMLFTTVLASCDKDKKQGSDSEWSLGDEGRSAVPDDIPEDVDLNGYEFNILFRGGDLERTETMGDISEAANPVHRTVYERNLRVQNRLNCTFNYHSTLEPSVGETQTAVRNHLEAENYYDYMLFTNNCIISLRMNHMLIDFNDAEYVDNSQPWWWDDVMKELSFDGRTMNYLVGDINIRNIQMLGAIYFNFDLLNERLQMQPSELYTLVNEKNWTIAKLDELSARCYRDLNGNGQEDTGDIFAFPYTVETAEHFSWCTKPILDIYERDTQGLVTLKMAGNNDIYRVATDVRKLLRENQGVRDYSATSGAFDTMIMGEFASNQYVFLAQRLWAACDDLLQMQTLYGILPYPTLDQGDDYISNIQASSSCIFAPKIAEKNLEAIGIAIEASCSEAYRYTYDAFFNMALKGRYTNDVESARMVDIIYESANKSFILEYGFLGNGIGSCFTSAITSNVNIMTYIDQRSGAQQAINNYIADVKGLIVGVGN